MRILRYAGLIAVLTLMAVMPAGAASAGKEKDLGSFGAWRTYTYDEGGQTVCYMVTAKTLKSTALKKRAGPYLMVTHRPVEASTDVVSYGSGVLLDSKHGVNVRVGKASFDLFSVRDTAWARDALTDHKLVAALRDATSAQVLSIPALHSVTGINDQFDLTGALSAYRAINKACGLPDVEPKKSVIKKTVVKKGGVQKPTVKRPAVKKQVVKKPAGKTSRKAKTPE